MNKIIETLLLKIIKSISPELKSAIRALIENLEQHAKRTTNPYDDILVELIKCLME